MNITIEEKKKQKTLELMKKLDIYKPYIAEGIEALGYFFVLGINKRNRTD